ncbi:MAG: hypothetical protein AB7E72_13480 [Lysobacterales bacterium]
MSEGWITRMAGLFRRRPTVKMTEQWYVKVYDNFHYMDESESYRKGPYPSAEAALQAARDVVENSLLESVGSLSQARDVDELIRNYRMFGADPVVEGEHPVEFSAWNYVDEIAPAVLAGKFFRAHPERKS